MLRPPFTAQEATIAVVIEPVVQLMIDIAAPAQHPKIDGLTTVRHVLRGPPRLSPGSVSPGACDYLMFNTGSPTEWSSLNRTGSSRGGTSTPAMAVRTGAPHRWYPGDGVIRLVLVLHSRTMAQSGLPAGPNATGARSLKPCCAEGCRRGCARTPPRAPRGHLHFASPLARCHNDEAPSARPTRLT